MNSKIEMEFIDDRYMERLRLRIFNKSILRPETGCLEWQGLKFRDGYGVLGHKKKKRFIAHRASFFAFKGDLIKGMLICHLCDNRSCVNPNHLYQGTHKDNTKDILNRKRDSRWFQDHCSKGHLLDEENTMKKISRTGTVLKGCRKCCNDGQRRRYAVKNELKQKLFGGGEK